VSTIGETISMTAHDQVLVNGLLEGGAPISLHYRGGLSGGTGLLWEINGADGDIQVSGANGRAQTVQLTVSRVARTVCCKRLKSRRTPVLACAVEC
jgi:hypothetical protein